MRVSQWLSAVALLAAFLTCPTHGATHRLSQLDTAGKAPWPHPQCNSAADDYAPALDIDARSILFTSERAGVAQTYQCSASGAVMVLEGTFNRPGMARAFASITAQGSGVATVYRSGERQSYASIVHVVRTSAGLDEGAPLDRVNGSFFAAQATISPDQSRIVYVSDREGGAGGLDIWMIERRIDGTWSEPQHAGESINSPGDELTPVLVSPDTLLFSSDGMGGAGGHDVYMSINRAGRWGDPIPVTPLNSAWNDTDATRLPDGTHMFSSDRPGGRGGLDIWIWKPE